MSESLWIWRLLTTPTPIHNNEGRVMGKASRTASPRLAHPKFHPSENVTSRVLDLSVSSNFPYRRLSTSDPAYIFPEKPAVITEYYRNRCRWLNWAPFLGAHYGKHVKPIVQATAKRQEAGATPGWRRLRRPT